MPFLRVNNINLHYDTAGRGEPLLFIHGLGSSGRDWQPQIDFFSRRYRVIVFDIRGHGQSDRPPGPYSIRLFTADTAKLIESLQIKPVHILGLSLGGMIAFQLAVDRPELLKSMVIVNIGPEVRLKSLKQWLFAIQRFAIVRFCGMRKMGKVLARELFPSKDHASIRDIFVERWAENDRKAYLKTMQAIVGWSVNERIDRIEIPTLVVASDHDYTPVAAKKTFVAQMPRAELVIMADTHHAVPVETPEKFNAIVEAFLKRQA